ncbi:sulfotransferase [Pyxidicoccus fallax]|uniref:Sulfotransferase domain-containing protein n=1 Tax=Pyxidicoccus fallax TaxID=394095 RepID=A0A848LWG0_9BACT|nr:sulfotransferase [Pyxidicoccus fallax]NMO21950.1 sulfotransferase domain-containing protein [Pyxidicoccus fallax]NPC84513.1 sulfotransferase [Pyxidicoccus fallax]
MRPPNLFIVGAPRCGTTSMHGYLQQHPEVFMSPVKEPHYWCSDLFPADTLATHEEYLALFSGADARHLRVGEASPTYLFSKVAPGRIRDFAPDARILIMLREPVDMLYSLHQRRVLVGNEDLLDFEAALVAEAPRGQGELPARGGLYRYREVGAYAEQVRRYFDTFGRERVHVILYDDFRKDVATTFRDTLRFLGLREDAPVDLSARNESRAIRSHVVHRLATRLRRLPLTQGLGARLVDLNTKPARLAELRPEVRRQLTAHFAPDVERLGALLGRDLAHWSRAAA